MTIDVAVLLQSEFSFFPSVRPSGYNNLVGNIEKESDILLISSSEYFFCLLNAKDK